MSGQAVLQHECGKAESKSQAGTKTVMVIGGTGVMGRRLVAHLAAHSAFNVTFTSRHLEKAEALAQALRKDHPDETIRGIAFDSSSSADQIFRDHEPFVVVDASGPFQNSDYAIPVAALRAGAHCLDLADARDYLTGFATALDPLARERGLSAWAGASSTPALSFTAVRKLAETLAHVDMVEIAITPGGHTAVGQAVVEAVLSYAGKPVPVWSDGRLETELGWSQATQMDVPGLGNRRVALVETVDAQLIGERLNVRDRVAFFAGLESKLEQFGMEGLGWLVQHGLPVPTGALAPLLHRLRRLTRIGMSDEGGMVVQMSGRDKNGQVSDRQWSLLARKGHGPFVPVMAAAALARKLVRDELTPGAGLACDALSLEEIEAEMEPYAITTKISDQSPTSNDQAG